jgi:hypothetical protein
MYTSQNLKSFICAAADDDHFIIKPVTLLCGHAVCYSCIESLKFVNRINILKCEICGKENTIDLDIVAESSIASNMINKSMNELFSDIRKRFEMLFSQFKGKINNIF